jgi:superfamily II DNA or RNA helicase
MKEYENIEFHRQGYGMLADLGEKDPGAPVCFPRTEGGRVMTGFCDCRENRKNGSCRHFSELTRLAAAYKKSHRGRTAWDMFMESRWHRLGTLLSEGDPLPCASTEVRRTQIDSGPVYHFMLRSGFLLARMLDASSAPTRFLERIGAIPRQGVVCRTDLIKKIADHSRTKEEQLLNNAGAITRRQASEQSFWGRLAYHAWREYGDAMKFHPIIDLEKGDFILQCFHKNRETAENDASPIIAMVIPRMRVRKVLALLAAEYPEQPDLAIHPVPLKSIFRVTPKTKLDIEVRPAILALQKSGEATFFEHADFTKFRYGDLVYLKELNVLAELEQSGSERRFSNPVSMRLKKSMLPAFLDEHGQDLADGNLVLDGPLRNLAIHREFDRMEIALDVLKRSWYWLSVHYGFGNDTVSLADILRARRDGKAYLETGSGWIDVRCDAFRALESIEKLEENQNDKDENENGNGQKVRLSASQFLRLTASFENRVQINGKEERAKILKRLLALEPVKPWVNTRGLTSKLRPYQLKGVDWLRFLSENRLGGLLCDDMGLGKTHQAMALMVWMKEKRKLKDPFLVVCPTTVISHWEKKLREHAPGLETVVYHGGSRTLTDSGGTVVLTSYGVLRNDIPVLRDIPFALAVFDEIQHLKNRDTRSHQAATMLQAPVRIGLTGTPVENSLRELKSLFDLVLPGYLGSDAEFEAGYIATGATIESDTGLRKLKKLISPFTLRRLKIDVLDELPEKIEDVRTCRLSDDQVKLYRDTLATKGAALLSKIRSDTEQLPYIHIFALLNLLKRICDHPALAMNRVEEYQRFQSGKWDLFQELLLETIDSGQKLVVFTQYLGMIVMMERLLGDLGIPHVTLTGASRDRGSIIRRFNEDDDCRVFLGSLKAGGTGIDLVGGSTVLHYDRWWNAAREDQATDRVYRIGQKRAVQVFKLVTEGTLEEKIAAIIERKRRLMNSVVEADNPHLDKIFTRDELVELLQPV